MLTDLSLIGMWQGNREIHKRLFLRGEMLAGVAEHLRRREGRGVRGGGENEGGKEEGAHIGVFGCLYMAVPRSSACPGMYQSQ